MQPKPDPARVAASRYVWAYGVIVTRAPKGWWICNVNWWLPNLWRLRDAS